MPIEKRWVVKPQGDSEAVAKLASVLRISPVLANLLVQRGIDTVEKADKFFKPSLADLHDPFLMKDMDKAVERVEQAVRNNEKIMVYGDYDVDGCTAVALVYKFLRQIGHKNLMFYIPDRYTEGYGISVKGIDLAARKGVGLIIALDCGIKATEKIVYAKSKGVDFIICDHHLPAEEIPRAVAVLDPKRVDCSYPFDELSGCGVGFKLVQAYAQKNRIPFEQISPLLDLLVVSIASDIVPLVDENRILAHFGLKDLNREPSKGLLSIIKICGLDKHNITIDDIVSVSYTHLDVYKRQERRNSSSIRWMMKTFLKKQIRKSNWLTAASGYIPKVRASFRFRPPVIPAISRTSWCRTNSPAHSTKYATRSPCGNSARNSPTFPKRTATQYQKPFR